MVPYSVYIFYVCLLGKFSIKILSFALRHLPFPTIATPVLGGITSNIDRSKMFLLTCWIQTPLYGGVNNLKHRHGVAPPQCVHFSQRCFEWINKDETYLLFLTVIPCFPKHCHSLTRLEHLKNKHTSSTELAALNVCKTITLDHSVEKLCFHRLIQEKAPKSSGLLRFYVAVTLDLRCIC